MSPVAGELGPKRGRGMPRSLPSPEHNLVQNPAVARGIARFAGMKQAHTMPAISEGLQAVLIAGDVREDPRTGLPASFAAFQEIAHDGINVTRHTFANPLGNDKVAVLRRLHVYNRSVAGAAVDFVYNLVYPTGFVLQIPIANRGQRLVSGFNQTVGGVGIPQPPVTGTEIPFPPPPSAMGFHNPPLTGIDGAYIWRGLIGSAAHPEVLEDFRPDRGPRIMVFPGGAFQAYAIDVNTDTLCNLWWDEYPLS